MYCPCCAEWHPTLQTLRRCSRLACRMSQCIDQLIPKLKLRMTHTELKGDAKFIMVRGLWSQLLKKEQLGVLRGVAPLNN